MLYWNYSKDKIADKMDSYNELTKYIGATNA